MLALSIDNQGGLWQDNVDALVAQRIEHLTSECAVVFTLTLLG
jgi:hypothetical protein